MAVKIIEKMKQLAMEHDVCVLATVSDRRPHCALMTYVTDRDCREIYMVTGRETTKYKNLEENPEVSLLIDTREEHSRARRETQALTVSGVFETIRDQGKRTWVRTMLLARHPHLRSILDDPDSELLRIRITSFLLLNGVTDAHFKEV